MGGLLDQLQSQAAWEEFLAHRLIKGRFTWPEFQDADSFVAGQGYLEASRRVTGSAGPGIPERMSVNKMGSGKKRTVYSFGNDATRVLKLLAHLLYKYDASFSPNLYSFRRGLKASDAIFAIRKRLDGRPMWAYKVDIHDYFNSISIPLLLPMLRKLLADDTELYAFFERMLTDPRASVDGKIVHCPKGVMAGTPTAPFLADVYLSGLDRHFAKAGVVYARYSDDIILFAPDRQSLERHKAYLLDFLKHLELEVNPSKERVYSPGEPFDFLGFKCSGNSIDISDATVAKMKGKIRRAARALHRWQLRKGLAPEQAMKGLIRSFNDKFFEDEDPQVLTWSRWFFPVINTPGGLKKIDACLQQYIRFLSTGRHTKANFRVRYSRMKELGFRSLVHEYYLFRRAKKS